MESQSVFSEEGNWEEFLVSDCRSWAMVRVPKTGRLASLIEEFRELWAAPGAGSPQHRAHLYLVQPLG